MRYHNKSPLVGNGIKLPVNKFSCVVRFFDHNSGLIHGSGVLIDQRWALGIGHCFRGGFKKLCAQNQLDHDLGAPGVEVVRIHFVEYGALDPKDPNAGWPPIIGGHWRLDQICLLELATNSAATFPKFAEPALGSTCRIAGFGSNPAISPVPYGHLLGGNMLIDQVDYANPGFYLTAFHKDAEPYPENDDSGCPYFVNESAEELIGIHCTTLKDMSGNFRSAFRSLDGYASWIHHTLKRGKQ